MGDGRGMERAGDSVGAPSPSRLRPARLLRCLLSLLRSCLRSESALVQRALVDVVAEVRLASEEAAQVAVVLDALRPVVREEDGRRGELHTGSARRNDGDKGGEAHEGEADDVVCCASCRGCMGCARNGLSAVSTRACEAGSY